MYRISYNNILHYLTSCICTATRYTLETKISKSENFSIFPQFLSSCYLSGDVNICVCVYIHIYSIGIYTSVLLYAYAKIFRNFSRNQSIRRCNTRRESELLCMTD